MEVHDEGTLVLAAFAVGFALSAQTDEATSFPKGFRRWAHVKNVLVGPQSPVFVTEGGIHHIYANDKALAGYDSGKFPDESVIVYDLLETKEVAGNIIEGQTRRLDVMRKQRARYASTGGWEFMSFSGNDQANGKLTPARQANCAGCHAHRKDMISFLANFANEHGGLKWQISIIIGLFAAFLVPVFSRR